MTAESAGKAAQPIYAILRRGRHNDTEIPIERGQRRPEEGAEREREAGRAGRRERDMALSIVGGMELSMGSIDTRH